MSFFNKLQNAMFDRDFPYSGTFNHTIGAYHAFTSENGECKKKCCRYRLFENDLGAHLSCWRRKLDSYWFLKEGNKLSYEEKYTLEHERNKMFTEHIIKLWGFDININYFIDKFDTYKHYINIKYELITDISYEFIKNKYNN